MWHRWQSWLNTDLAVDLGSSAVRIAVPREGVVLDEPAVVALHQGTRQVLGRGTAVGLLARQMVGRTPDSISARSPIERGVIADYELCEAMLRYFLRKTGRLGAMGRARLVIPVPGLATAVERRAVFNSMERAGAGPVYLLPTAKAAAIGCGLPISEPLASLICHIGAGSTEIAVFSLSEAVASESLRFGGQDFDTAIVEHLRNVHALKVGLATAEQLKLRIGSAWPLDAESSGEVSGLDLRSGVPRKGLVTTRDVQEAFRQPLNQLLRAIKRVIEQCHPELVGDLAETGLVLSGGAACLTGLDLLLQEQLGIPVRRADHPRHASILGAAICAEHLRRFRDSLESSDRAA
jgi:rod shape-determining protein MreB